MTLRFTRATLAAAGLMALAAVLSGPVAAARQDQVVHATLDYRRPGSGPAPNFSPKGSQVVLAPVDEGARLPAGVIRPAKSGVIKIGPTERAWIPVLAAASPDHPADLCRLLIDRNRNGNFLDDGPALEARTTQNAKTKAWWSSVDDVELSIPYADDRREPYMVSFWIVREDEAPAPDLLRFSVRSWRSGTVTINGIQALVAAMDGDNNAVFDQDDYWSVLSAAEPNAEKAVLSFTEARPTSRMMFLAGGPKELVLDFRGFSRDGRSIDFAVVDRPVTKAEDRAGDDTVREERPRPRTTTPVSWLHDFEAAAAQARSAGRRILIDFEATWCGPCHTMDEWIWTDAEVASVLNAGYVGVKLDGDIEKALVKRFNITGYPTMILLDPSGTEIKRAVGYQSSKDTLALLRGPQD
jgi:thiol-disulfide isomerase/thioredoxin